MSNDPLWTAGSVLAGVLITALFNRFSSKESNAGALLATITRRLTDQEGTIAKMQESIRLHMDEALKWEDRWREERDAKHAIQSDYQSAVLKYELAVEELKHKHSEEMTAAKHNCERELELLAKRIRELERHVGRLEGGSDPLLS